MTKAVEVVNQNKYLTAQEIQANARLIQDVMKAVMKDGVHYGKVPGCGDKPTLLKPGAEKILSTFRIAVFPEIKDLSSMDSIRYQVITKGVFTGAGANVELGCGVGECSSDEEKYKWRKAIGKEYDETPEDRRRKKWKRYQGKEYLEVQVRTNPSDLANTILKMAKKRSIVDLTLTVTAASDCFNQDIEDLPAEYISEEDAAQGAPPAMPKAKTEPVAAPPAQEEKGPAESRPLPPDYKLLQAKYDGLCKGCGQEIKIGMEIAYSKAKGNFHVDCVQ